MVLMVPGLAPPPFVIESSGIFGIRVDPLGDITGRGHSDCGLAVVRFP